MHPGLQVRVLDDDYLKRSLEEASWVDSQSTYLDVLALGGLEAVVVCDKEAKTMGRVGIRTREGYEDAVPLTALQLVEDRHTGR